MNEQELLKMVVRLWGDATSYIGMATQAIASTKEIVSNVSAASSQVRALGAGLKAFAASTVGVLGMFGVASTLQGAFNKFLELEKLTIGLTAAIKSNGGAVDETMSNYQEYIKTVQNTTLVTRATTMRMLEQAEVQGFTGDAAKNAVTTAIALAKGNDQMASSYMRVALMIQRGHPEFARRILGLQGIKDNAELVVKIQQRLAAGLEVAGAHAESTAGQLEKFKRSLASITYEIGGTVAEFLHPIITFVSDLLKWYGTLSKETKRTTAIVVGVLVAFLSLAPTISLVTFLLGPFITAISFIASLLSALAGVIATPVGALVTLAAIFQTVMYGTILYKLGVIGAVIDWFGQKWVELKAIVVPALTGIGNAIKAGDMELAWKIAWVSIKLIFWTVIGEIQGLWIGLTVFLKESLAEAVAWIVSQLERAAVRVVTNIMHLMGPVGAAISLPVEKALNARLDESLKEIDRTRKELLKEIGDKGRNDMGEITKGLSDLAKERDKLVAQAAAAAISVKMNKLAPPVIPPIPPVNVKLVPKFDAAAFYSVEALDRVQRFYDTMSLQLDPTGAVKEAPKKFEAAGSATVEGIARADEQTKVLKDIRDILKRGEADGGVEINPAGFA